MSAATISRAQISTLQKTKKHLHTRLSVVTVAELKSPNQSSVQQRLLTEVFHIEMLFLLKSCAEQTSKPADLNLATGVRLSTKGNRIETWRVGKDFSFPQNQNRSWFSKEIRAGICCGLGFWFRFFVCGGFFVCAGGSFYIVQVSKLQLLQRACCSEDKLSSKTDTIILTKQFKATHPCTSGVSLSLSSSFSGVCCLFLVSGNHCMI